MAKTPAKAHLARHGYAADPSPLLALRSLHAPSRQHMHCVLHVLSLGCFHVMVCTTARALRPAQWAAVVAGLGDRERFPQLNSRFRDIKVADKAGKMSLRVGGRKANGVDVDMLMPGLIYWIVYVVETSGGLPLQESFVASVTESNLGFWRQHCGGAAHGPLSKAGLVQKMLVTLLDWFQEAYFLLGSRSSSEAWEDRQVMPGCQKFIQGVRNFQPFLEALKNKPKALAVVELAMQRQGAGSAQAFSQVMRETGHRSQRNSKFRSNMKYPELWVMASVHTRMLMRFLVEGGTFGVFHVEVDAGTGRPTGAGFAPYRCSGQLTALLTGVFVDKGSIPEGIAAGPRADGRAGADANWIEERRVPRAVRGRVRMKKMLRKTQLASWRPACWAGTRVIVGNGHPAAHLSAERLSQNTSALRVVAFEELHVKLGAVELARTVVQGSVVQVVGGSMWLVKHVYCYRMQQGNETFSLLEAVPMHHARVDGHAYGTMQCRTMATDEQQARALVDAALVTAVPTALRACTAQCAGGQHVCGDRWVVHPVYERSQ